MSAYWIARVKISDQESYQEYVKRAPDVFKTFGAKFLARGGVKYVLEGNSDFTRSVIIEFPDAEQALACHQSPEYQAAAEFRQGVSIVDAWVVENV